MQMAGMACGWTLSNASRRRKPAMVDWISGTRHGVIPASVQVGAVNRAEDGWETSFTGVCGLRPNSRGGVLHSGVDAWYTCGDRSNSPSQVCVHGLTLHMVSGRLRASVWQVPSIPQLAKDTLIPIDTPTLVSARVPHNVVPEPPAVVSPPGTVLRRSSNGSQFAHSTQMVNP